MPKKTGLAFALVQHLDPTRESHLSEILARATEMPVVEVKDGMHLDPDRVYVIPPNASMSVSDGTLTLAARAEGRGRHLPIDHFFESLASHRGNKAIGVVLSGNASDGTMGLKAIKAAGGIAFAQDEAEREISRHAAQRDQRGLRRFRAAAGEDRGGTGAARRRDPYVRAAKDDDGEAQKGDGC